jgi:signal peptidase I
MELLLTRIDDSGVQTIGKMYALDDYGAIKYMCDTLELPWKENQRNISCIPPGKYDVVKRKSSKFGNHFHVKGVPDRSYILIHKGNYYTDIRGCILVGEDLADINKDGHMDVTSSSATMKDLLSIMPDKFTLTIQE